VVIIGLEMYDGTQDGTERRPSEPGRELPCQYLIDRRGRGHPLLVHQMVGVSLVKIPRPVPDRDELSGETGSREHNSGKN
jgi:hypothetical protein